MPEPQGGNSQAEPTCANLAQNKRDEKFAPARHQRLIARYISPDTPYRGVLLYHGLGSGKTCTAIGAASAFCKSGSRIVVLLPAALEQNMIAEWNKCGPGGEHAACVSYFHYNGLTPRAYSGLMSALDHPGDTVVIIDEVHNLINNALNRPASLVGKLHALLSRKLGIRVLALSGSPFINVPREIAYMVNLIRGCTPVHELTMKAIAAATTRESLSAVLNAVQGMRRTLFIDFGNRRARVCLDPSQHGAWADVLERIYADAKKIGVEFDATGTHLVFDDVLPQNPEPFFKEFIDPVTFGIKNAGRLMGALQGIVSYYHKRDKSLYPRIVSDEIVSCTMSEHQFARYRTVRMQEISRESSRARAQRGMQDQLDVISPAAYRSFSRMHCNFVLPEKVRRPTPQDTDAEEDGGSVASETGGTREPVRKAYSTLLKRVVQQVVDMRGVVLRSNLQMHSCKYAAILERLDSVPGCAMVYSNFRTLEGLWMFAETLKARGFEEFLPGVMPTDPKKPMFINYSGDRVVLDVFNSEFSRLPDAILDQVRVISRAKGVDLEKEGNTRGSIVRVILISPSGAEGISLRNVRSCHVMEPYWSGIKIDQVIGRAVRTCSHASLPDPDRTVSVFRYVARAPKEAMASEKKLLEKDKWLTSDEVVLDIATKKGHVVGQLLDLMRRAAVDCWAHGGEDCGLKPGVDTQKARITRVQVNNKEYALMRDTNELYDWVLFQKGVLRRVGRLEPVRVQGKNGFRIVQSAKSGSKSTARARR